MHTEPGKSWLGIALPLPPLSFSTVSQEKYAWELLALPLSLTSRHQAPVKMDNWTHLSLWMCCCYAVLHCVTIYYVHSPTLSHFSLPLNLGRHKAPVKKVHRTHATSSWPLPDSCLYANTIVVFSSNIALNVLLRPSIALCYLFTIDLLHSI